MDVHKYSTQTERLDVVETGRRRRWSDDEKLRIVLESLETPRAISSTARRHGISRSLLMTWRRAFRAHGPGHTAERLCEGSGCYYRDNRCGTRRTSERPHGDRD